MTISRNPRLGSKGFRGRPSLIRMCRSIQLTEIVGNTGSSSIPAINDVKVVLIVQLNFPNPDITKWTLTRRPDSKNMTSGRRAVTNKYDSCEAMLKIDWSWYRMEQAEFYPKELWKHSPVYNSYVPLFANDIHTLQTSREGTYPSSFLVPFNSRPGMYRLLAKSPNQVRPGDWYHCDLDSKRNFRCHSA